MIAEAMKRRAALTESLARLQKCGFTLSLLTLTCQHYRTDSLKEVFAKLFAARRTMRNRTGWKKLLAASESEILVRTTEITHAENGWHVHTHEIIVSTRPISPDESESIFDEWSKASVTAGLKAPSRKAYDLHTCDGAHGAEYLTKYDVSKEMTDATIKHSQGGYTYCDLLKLAQTGSKHAISLVEEYAAGTKGRQKMEFSKGWQDLLAPEYPEPEREENENAATDADVIILDSFDDQTWAKILEHCARYRILLAYKSGGQRGGRDALDALWKT
jgi:hypothetical protein